VIEVVERIQNNDSGRAGEVGIARQIGEEMADGENR
jgi:hypothetical protein